MGEWTESGSTHYGTDTNCYGEGAECYGNDSWGHDSQHGSGDMEIGENFEVY